MISDLANVAEFQEKLGHGYTGPPRDMPFELACFRLRFLAEELQELGHALGFTVTTAITPAILPLEVLRPDALNWPRLAAALDALVDLDYVLKGTVLQAGLGAVYPEAWRRVHAANLKKVIGVTERGYTADAAKPANWRPPDLSDLVQ